MSEKALNIGQKVANAKDNEPGIVAYVGVTEFAPGKWVGVILDQPKGKNNGSVQGKSYFECPDKHGKLVELQLTDPLPPFISTYNVHSSPLSVK